MALTQRGEHRYGETPDDIREEILRYGRLNEYEAHHFGEAVCTCGNRTFMVAIDDTAGVALRYCPECEIEHPIGDGADFLDEADPEKRICICGEERFEVVVGVSLYEGSDDVRWMYVGCRCPACGLTGVYGDWKNEFLDYREFMKRV